jgi:hypothetical protein
MAEKCWKMTFTGNKWQNILPKDQAMKQYVHSNSLNPHAPEQHEFVEPLIDTVAPWSSPQKSKMGKANTINVQDYTIKEIRETEKLETSPLIHQIQMPQGNVPITLSMIKSPTISQTTSPVIKINFKNSSEQHPIVSEIAIDQPTKKIDIVNSPPESEAQIEFLYRLWGKAEPKPIVNLIEKARAPRLLKKQATDIPNFETRNSENPYKISHKRDEKIAKSYNYIIRMSESRFILKKHVKTNPLELEMKAVSNKQSGIVLPDRVVNFNKNLQKEVYTQIIQFRPENVGKHHCNRFDHHDIEEKKGRILRKTQTGTFNRK